MLSCGECDPVSVLEERYYCRRHINDHTHFQKAMPASVTVPAPAANPPPPRIREYTTKFRWKAQKYISNAPIKRSSSPPPPASNEVFPAVEHVLKVPFAAAVECTWIRVSLDGDW